MPKNFLPQIVNTVLTCTLLLNRLSGLIVDIFKDVAVIASSAAWVEKYKQQIKVLISRLTNVNHISWRPSIEILKEEGLDLSGSTELNLSDAFDRVQVTLFTWPTVCSLRHLIF